MEEVVQVEEVVEGGRSLFSGLLVTVVVVVVVLLVASESEYESRGHRQQAQLPDSALTSCRSE